MRRALAILLTLAVEGCSPSLIAVKGAPCPAVPQPPPPITIHYETCDGNHYEGGRRVPFAACFTPTQFGELTKALQAQNDYDKEMRQ